MRSLIIDTDGGTDDATALWWALTDSRVDVAAILVTWGNVDRDTAATNVARVLQAAGRSDVPVALGAVGPTASTPLAGLARYVHGPDGLGGCGDRWPTGKVTPTHEPAAQLLARLTAEAPGGHDLVTIGPLSTLAAALGFDPEIAARLRSLAVMGGAVRHSGNVLPWREANIAHDPAAASVVMTADWPSPPLLVGLDVTMRALLHADDLDLAEERGTLPGRFLADPLRAYADFYRANGQLPPGTLPCHDLLAALAIVEPEVIVDAPTVPLAVDTGGSAAWGATVADLRPDAAVQEAELPGGFAPWRVALDVDVDRFRAAFRAVVS